jgi:hypothetical protein
MIGSRTAVAAVILGIVLSAAPSTQAAINFVADLGANEVTTNSLSITTTATAPAGSSIIMLTSARGDTTPTAVTCSDGAGHAYTIDVSLSTPLSNTLGAICATHQIAAALPAGSTLTVNWTGGGAPFFGRARAFAVTGLASTPLDRTAAATGTSTSPSSGAAATTTQAEELLVGLINDITFNVAGAGFTPGTNGTTNNCATSGSPTYTALAGVGTVDPPSLFSMYCIVAATGAYAARATTTTSTWQALLATYKALLAPPTIAKAFGTANLNAGGTTTLSFTLTNSNAATSLTGVGFTDTLPGGLVVATPNGLTGSCGGGTITATAGSNTISLAGATLAAGASCTFAVNVTGTTAGTKNNTTSNVTSVEAGNGNVATASLTVAAPVPPTIAKAFGATTLTANATTTLTFTLTNPNAAATLTGVGFTDPLPAGLVVATPNGLTGSCGGGTITATAGSSTISLAGATLAGGATCTFAVNVTATAAGTKVNTTSAVTSTEAGPGNAATASVTIANPSIPALSSFGQALVVLIVVLSGLLFLRRQLTVGR